MGSKEENSGLTRVRYELRRTGLPLQPPHPLRSGVHTRGYLPHVKREGAAYFVTFRLADSLPREVLLQMEAERASHLRGLHIRAPGESLPDTARSQAIEREHHRKIERFLDKGVGECWLNWPEIAQIVANAMLYFDDQRYHLDAWVVMPNHAHAVLWPMPNHLLSDILQSWKRYSARETNRLLGRTGQPFWQPESFDHWIRDDAEHARCCRYVELNPVHARLCATPEAWRWSSAWRSFPQP